MIYKHTFTPGEFRPKKPEDTPSARLGLLSTCKQVHGEALAIAYEKNIINIYLAPIRWLNLPFNPLDHHGNRSLHHSSNNHQQFLHIQNLSLSYDISTGYEEHILTARKVIANHLIYIADHCPSLKHLTLNLLEGRDWHPDWRRSFSPAGNPPSHHEDDALEDVIQILRPRFADLKIFFHDGGNHLTHDMIRIAGRGDWEESFLGTCRELIEWDSTGWMSDNLQAELFPSRMSFAPLAS